MILLTLLAAAALQSGQIQTKTPADTTEATAEGIEILRRLLSESLNKAFARKGESRSISSPSAPEDPLVHVNGLVTTLWAGGETVQHSRAFHLPGAGLFFALDASLPVVVKEARNAPTDGDKPKDDEWEQVRREVRGGGNTTLRVFSRRSSAKEAVIDPATVDQVIDLVLRALARHASRVEGLASHETITVALHLSGRGRSFLNTFDTRPSAPDGENEDDSEAEGNGFLFDGDLTTAYVLASGFETGEQRLVIRVTVGDLAGQAESAPERLRQRAQINRY
jgi:hypothetical protein